MNSNDNSSVSTPLSEHDFENIVSELKVGILIVNYGSDLVIEYANNYFYKLMGYSKSEYHTLFGNSIIPRIYPDDVQKLKATIGRQLSMGGTIRYEFRILKKDGSIAWFSLNGTKHFTNAIHLRITLVDITESKLLQNNIAEKNLELDTIYNNIHGGLIKICLPDFRVIYANDGFFNLIDYTKEEFLHKFNNIILDFIHPDDLEKFTELSDSCPSSIQLNFRTVDKCGETKWNLLNSSRIGTLDGKPLYLCTVIDITETKHHEEKLEFEQTKQRIITDLSGEWIWEYDIATETYSRVGSKTMVYDSDNVVPYNIDTIINNNLIHKDDINSFLSFSKQITLGIEKIESEIRILNNNNSTSWYKVVATTMYDSDGDPICVVGKTTNIDSTRSAITELEDKAIRDSLTHVYNRTEFQRLTEEKLNSVYTKLPYTLILADIDNFRSINDSLGHLFGDSLLIEAATIFSNVFPDAIVGRVGTDVFGIFIQNTSSQDFIEESMTNIREMFSNIYSADKEEYNITCSIGVAYCTSAEPNYEVLFRKADIALFAAKDKGKNTHVYYDISLGFNADNNMLNEYNMKDSFSSLQASIDSAIITTAIDLLFDAKDTISAVKILLAKMREHFDGEYIKLATIKENRNNNYTIKDIWIPNTYRASSKSTSKPAELIDQHLTLFNSDKLFYCSDISTINAISPLVYEEFKTNDTKSVLQCANIQNDKLKGFVSIATCSDTKSWNVGDVRTFSILCKILFAAIGKLPIK